MTVCVHSDYLSAHVEVAVLEAFGTGMMRNGRPAFFHPDNLTFGANIYLSQVVATAQAVTGVQNVQVTRLERLYFGANHEIETGVLPIGPLEIAQLDRNANFPERGWLKLTMRGGQ
jgi:hypothetical protein